MEVRNSPQHRCPRPNYAPLRHRTLLRCAELSRGNHGPPGEEKHYVFGSSGDPHGWRAVRHRIRRLCCWTSYGGYLYRAGLNRYVAMLPYGHRLRQGRKLLLGAINPRVAPELHVVQEEKTAIFISKLAREPSDFRAHIRWCVAPANSVNIALNSMRCQACDSHCAPGYLRTGGRSL